MKFKLIHFLLAALLVISVLPIQYFFVSSFNPLPLQIFAAGILMVKFYNLRLKNLPIIVLVFSLLLLVSKVNIAEYVSSAVTATFLIFSLIIFYKKPTQAKLDIFIVSILFLVFIVIFTTYFNLTFNGVEASKGRSKGFGSGTIYALLAVYGLVYLFLLFRNKLITKWIFYLAAVPLIWALLLTQSRGAMLTVAGAFFVIGLKSLKWFQILFLCVGFGFLFFYTPVGDRFNISQYDSFNQFTSGRAETQTIIIDKILDPNHSSQWIGFGLNSIKELVNNRDLEYPHFDILFVFYEGGIILLLIYFLCLFKIYKLFDSKILFWIFIVSTFHTNMLLSPGFLMLSKLLDTALINKLNFNTPSLNENNTGISN